MSYTDYEQACAVRLTLHAKDGGYRTLWLAAEPGSLPGKTAGALELNERVPVFRRRANAMEWVTYLRRYGYGADVVPVLDLPNTIPLGDGEPWQPPDDSGPGLPPLSPEIFKRFAEAARHASADFGSIETARMPGQILCPDCGADLKADHRFVMGGTTLCDATDVHGKRCGLPMGARLHSAHECRTLAPKWPELRAWIEVCEGLSGAVRALAWCECGEERATDDQERTLWHSLVMHVEARHPSLRGMLGAPEAPP